MGRHPMAWKHPVDHSHRLNADIACAIKLEKARTRKIRPPTRLKVVLCDIEPALARVIMQAAIGWTNAHLHQFVPEATYGMDKPCLPKSAP